MSSNREPTSRPSKKRIAVVGGGITGLVAAYRLAQQGHAVSLFERGPFLGGLASGFTIGGKYLEKAYHHLFTTDEHMLNLARELGVEDALLFCKASTAVYHNGQLYPFASALDLLRFSPLPLVDRVRFGIVTLWLQHTKHWRRLIGISAATWLQTWYGIRAYAVIWEPLLKGKFHNHFEQVSMAWLWARICMRANSKYRGEDTIVYFKGGFQVLIDALEKKLETLGVRIQLGANIEHVTSNAEGPELKLVDRAPEHFNSIICTVPSRTFVKLIHEDPHCTTAYVDQLQSIEYLGAVLVVFSSPQSLSRFYWHNINDPTSPLLVFLQHTNLVNKEHYGGNHVYYLGAYLPHDHRFFTMSDHEIFQEFFAQLKKIFPAFAEESIREKFLFRFKNAQHVVDANYEKKIPSYQTPLPKVFLANFSQIFPEDRGTNFAVREGSRIAQLVNESLCAPVQ